MVFGSYVYSCKNTLVYKKLDRKQYLRYLQYIIKVLKLACYIIVLKRQCFLIEI